MEKDYSYRAPTNEELYALEKRAREERARVLAAGLASAGSALKSLFARGFSTRAPKGLRHA